MLKPEVGDIVVVELEVADVIPGAFCYEMHNGSYSVFINCKRITKIKPRPIQVGDEVDIKGKINLDIGYTVLAIHGNGKRMGNGDARRWAVVAFKDDIPEVVHISKLTRRTSC